MARIQSLFKYHREVYVFIFFLLVTIILITLPSSVKTAPVKSLNRVIMTPVMWASAHLTRIQLMEENIAALRAENARLSLELSRAEDLLIENARLEELLAFSRESAVYFLPALVLSISLDEPVTTIVIDKGRVDGVTIDSPVMTPQGLVGKVIEADHGTSLVELFTHPQFRAAAMVPACGEMGIVKSDGNDLLLTGLSLNTRIIAGDRVVTSGLGGVYPAGIPIGLVAALEDDEVGIETMARIEPCVPLSGLFEVALLLDEAYVDADTTSLRRGKGSLLWLWDQTAPEETD
jgi:rod shape-determining protein MreC